MLLFYTRNKYIKNYNTDKYEANDAPMNETPHEAASALPSNSVTSRNAALSSHLLPTNMTGICVISCPFNSLINDQIALNSSRLCFEHTEYTNIKAWPFVIDNRCIAGNWWLPVVSVICKVQMFLLQLMTCQKTKKKEKRRKKNLRNIIWYFSPSSIWYARLYTHL